MAYPSRVRSTPALLLLTALGCSTAVGVDTGGGGGTGDQEEEDDLTPDAEGDACGPDLLAWQTACNFVGVISYENPLVPGELQSSQRSCAVMM